VWYKAKVDLVANFASTETMKRMRSQITSPVLKELFYTVLRHKQPYRFSDSQRAFAEKLAEYGAIEMDPINNYIKASAPIIQQVILFCILYFYLFFCIL
jgi:hypothetical protein